MNVKKAAGLHGVWALVLGLCGCSASLSANARVGASGETEGEANEFDEPLPAGVSSLTASSAESSRVLLGARHDLKLAAGGPTASCKCLSVGLGASRTEGLRWSGPPPQLDDATQLAIAVSSEIAQCKDEPKGSQGASYWGYRISGNDVVVLIEAARAGRPQTHGAVIPRPVGSGQVYVGPESREAPYGQPLEGGGLCKVGNPGSTRNIPFSELELGADSRAK